MTNLLQSVVDKLIDVFGYDIPIYTEKQEQGVERPCVFVRLSYGELLGQLDNRFYLNNLITITYMSDCSDLYRLEEVRFRLLAGMRHIQTKVGVHGQNLQARIMDSDVVFTGEYNMWIERQKTPLPLMESLEQDFRSDIEGEERVENE